MKHMITAALAAASLFALASCNKQTGTNESAANQSATASSDAISGTWKADLASVQIDAKPDQYLIKDGQYDCSTCTPPLTIAADGAFHPVTGRPYADKISVKIVDDHTVTRASQKGGRDTGGSTMKVSADGNKLTVDWRDSSTPNAAPVTGQYTETRVAAGPAGAHALSGSWKADKVNSVSEDALNVTYTIAGDMLSMSSAGQSYTAKLGGPEAPVKGDIGGTTVSAERVGDKGIRETYHRGGKVVSVVTSTIATDGKMSVLVEDKQQQSTTRYTEAKSS